MPKTKLISEVTTTSFFLSLRLRTNSSFVQLNELQTLTIGLVRQSKDSLFSSDRYLTRVHLRRPIKDDVVSLDESLIRRSTFDVRFRTSNLRRCLTSLTLSRVSKRKWDDEHERSTLTSFSSKAMGFMGSGFNAINVGDEIIEINNQVVVSSPIERAIERSRDENFRSDRLGSDAFRQTTAKFVQSEWNLFISEENAST